VLRDAERAARRSAGRRLEHHLRHERLAQMRDAHAAESEAEAGRGTRSRAEGGHQLSADHRRWTSCSNDTL